MKKYRRIEVNAFRRRVTVISGEWPPGSFDPSVVRADDEVSLNDADFREPVLPDSPEGQLILVEAVRTLERRLSPEARASICDVQKASISNSSNGNRLSRALRLFYQLIRPTALRFARKEK